MRTIWLALAALAASAPPAWALDQSMICKRLHDLGSFARNGEPERVSFKIYSSGGQVLFTCNQSDKAASLRPSFCEAAVWVGADTPHQFPWIIYNCVRTVAAEPRVTTTEEFTGMKKPKLTRLYAKLGDGVWMDSAWTPAPDADQGPNKGYYGRYDLVVWKPAR